MCGSHRVSQCSFVSSFNFHFFSIIQFHLKEILATHLNVTSRSAPFHLSYECQFSQFSTLILHDLNLNIWCHFFLHGNERLCLFPHGLVRFAPAPSWYDATSFYSQMMIEMLSISFFHVRMNFFWCFLIFSSLNSALVTHKFQSKWRNST